MEYTREELLALPINKVIDIVLKQQEELASVVSQKRMLEKISRLINLETNDSKMDVTTHNREICSKRGRRPYTEEEKAAAYERQKERQRLNYHMKKMENKESQE